MSCLQYKSRIDTKVLYCTVLSFDLAFGYLIIIGKILVAKKLEIYLDQKPNQVGLQTNKVKKL